MMYPYLAQVKTLLDNTINRRLTREEKIESAIKLAALIQNAANAESTKKERIFLSEISQMIKDYKGKIFTFELTDQVFRTNSYSRAANQLQYLFNKYGDLSFLTPFQQLAVKLFKKFGEPLSFIFIPLMKQLIYQKTKNVILPGEPYAFINHIKKRKSENIRLNINHLGEAILGEKESRDRLDVYLKDLENPLIEYISVKISTLFSQIQLLDWDGTLRILSKRYKKLLIASKNNFFISKNGERINKFVNLDMEEYRDVQLTVALFKKVLSFPECKDISAGIVLQSYLPDSFKIQQELTDFALKRVANGGAPIKIRLVKGANLSMERIEASIKGWPLATYSQKADVDANFKKMLHYGLKKEYQEAVLIGVGSHNIFDIAYALILACESGVPITIEMLEGMAKPSQRVIQRITNKLLLYCPVVLKKDFQNAIAYLIRRLDENTSPENFLRVAFDLVPGSSTWSYQADLFSQSVKRADEVSDASNRKQERNQNIFPTFSNEPDTDWSLKENINFGKKLLKEWENISIPPIPLIISGKEITTKELEKGIDPSRPGFSSYQYFCGTENEIDLALNDSKKAMNHLTSIQERVNWLNQAGKQLQRERKNLMGSMLRDVGKSLYESDAEVSEAIDFAFYYARVLIESFKMEDVQFKPKGVSVIASPWNFPCSIPVGGILGSLAAGNVVIFKPAPEAVLVGYTLVQALYKAGIPKELLHFLPCKDKIAEKLVSDTRTSVVVLTGGTQTAERLLKICPGLDLAAETGGKNSIIVTALADRDLAIRDIVQSAFGYSGQKCSACSLAILEAEVFDDPQFKKQLIDAVASLKVGSAYNLSSKITPLIKPPSGNLKEALQLGNWLVTPHINSKNPHLVGPGIQWDVKPGSFSHQNELFGPILSVIRANNLIEAIDIANETPYGLTAGIHSLDEREHMIWLERIEAGNCYINRGITGAIVNRQPFGGTKKSSFGPSLKAGGPNYLFALMHVEQKNGENSHLKHWEQYFSKNHELTKVLGQSNVLRYVPYKNMILRVQPNDSVEDVETVISAAKICETPLKVSIHPGCKTHFDGKVESDEEFIINHSNGRVRLISWPEDSTVKRLSEKGMWQIPKPVVKNGRIELLNYLREVSLSYDYHRYGNLGQKSHEFK